ncbi:unnamed protein product [Chrysoparadoxa australica]
MTSSAHSELFYPYRALGMVTDGACHALNRLGSRHFITTSIGRSFQIYQCDRLRLELVSPLMTEKISCMAVRGNKHTYVGCKTEVHCYKRLVCTGVAAHHPGHIRLLLCIGDTLVTACCSKLRSWRVKHPSNERGDMINDMSFPPDFTPSAMCHPPTYVNKVVVGSEQGSLALWNVQKGKLVYIFKSVTGSSAVTCIEASPALDVAAIGRASGAITLNNLKTDTVLFEFTQSSRVMSLSFRTDSASDKLPMLASGGAAGTVQIWDLKNRRLHVTMTAHESNCPVTGLNFFAKEPILLSLSTDNSIKMWIFDSPDGSARLLRSRSGHHKPPRQIQYWGNTTLLMHLFALPCLSLLTHLSSCISPAGQDQSFRLFHTIRDCLSVELSQKPLVKVSNRHQLQEEGFRLKPIVAFATCDTRSRDWYDIITVHEGDCSAYAWRYRHRAIGQHVLSQKHWKRNSMMHPEDPKCFGSAVAISVCGNYGLVGTQGGEIYKYNLQSGEARGSFPVSCTPKPKQFEKSLPGSVVRIGDKGAGADVTDAADSGHSGRVTGVAVDAVNKVLVSAGLDGQLIFWDFHSHKQLQTVTIGVSISHLELVRDTGLLATACDDCILRLYDISTRCMVRRLTGHTSYLSALCFTADGRRLISAAMDSTLRVWDLPTGRCVDWLEFKKPVVGISIAPSGEFMCTSHTDRLGINVWADRRLFQAVYLDTTPQVPHKMDEPAPMPEALGAPQLIDLDGFEGESTAVDGQAQDSDELAPEFIGEACDGRIVLSALPPAFWKGLFNLEIIKARNAPIEAPKKPPRAPFFIPTVRKEGGVDPSFAPAPAGAEAPAALEADPAGWGEKWSDDEHDEGEQEAEDEGKPDQSEGEEDGVKKRRGAAQHSTSRIIPSGKRGRVAITRSKTADLLRSSSSDQGFELIMKHLAKLGPPAVDVELSSLCQGEHDEEGLELLEKAMDWLEHEIRSRHSFDVTQAYLHRFITLYASSISKSGTLRSKADALLQEQKSSSHRLKELVQQNLCLLQYLGNQA